MMGTHDELNGEQPTKFDPETATLPEVAGFMLSLDAEVRTQGVEQKRQGKLIDKIATSLGIAIDKSEPPPPFRKMLDSQNEEIEKLQKTDAEITGQFKVVSAQAAEAQQEAAQTKLIVRVGLIEGVPKLVKVIGALVAVLGTLALLGQQIWSAVHGH